MAVTVDSLGHTYRGYEELMFGTTKVHCYLAGNDSNYIHVPSFPARTIFRTTLGKPIRRIHTYIKELTEAGLSTEGPDRSCGIIHIATNSTQAFITIYPDETSNLPSLLLTKAKAVKLFGSTVIFEEGPDFDLYPKKGTAATSGPFTTAYHQSIPIPMPSSPGLLSTPTGKQSSAPAHSTATIPEDASSALVPALTQPPLVDLSQGTGSPIHSQTISAATTNETAMVKFHPDPHSIAIQALQTDGTNHLTCSPQRPTRSQCAH
jgi:hypothetical protein